MSLTDPDRLFPYDGALRGLARAIYSGIKDLPILSPHGHCDPRWFAENDRFPNPAELFVIPDHYVFRMLVSQGVPMEALGIARQDGSSAPQDPRKVWQLFADHFHLFRGTPSGLWLNHAFEHVFGFLEPLTPENADSYYDHIDDTLGMEQFRPRALFDRFKIECLATTEGALDDLRWHKQIIASDWEGRVITTYRPDAVVDPEFKGFAANLDVFGALTGEDIGNWAGYLNAHRTRRAYFRDHGATATDHGHPTAQTLDLPQDEAAALYAKVLSGDFTSAEAEAFRGQMLTEMARMSVEDGMVMQIHAGARRNHNASVYADFGRDMGFDIPQRTDFVSALKPMLDAVGMEPDLTILLFTLDETTYGRELAPLAGAYPALKLGPAWWFFDSPEGIKRYRQITTETCGFYNTAGFNDDTRAFCSIPARHDVSRRVDAAFLAELVATGRLNEEEAFDLARALTVDLVKSAYKL
ncbi:glucuronate isomerase [Tropicibacter sp. R15_0]|uniref:glucuronate isomerase n=1 Tax=Tropicibacter sp. R15_0 TaxID=2821101 RepID=UPI001ADB16E6|nr:glucuronate isomerase [Tropicibacter sp. R15_0]MBO9465605.1 glucuronate isomerase [Tropicibacter sp. R15_0]